ncbi:MAG: hypothetical protein ACREQ2_01010 [Candidatus Binatia bacterium]
MGRRFIGVLLSMLLIAVSTIDTYGRAAQKNITFTLEIETSYFSLDLLDDFNDGTRPTRTINWSPREKITAKLILGAKVRWVSFTPPAFILYGRPGQSRLISQDIFRFQEVFRI